MFAVISSYARSMTRTKKAVQHDVADAEDQSDDFEEDRSSRRIQSALFGYVLKIAFAILGGVVGAIVAGFLKPYFPDDFGHKGATLSHPGWGGSQTGFLPFPVPKIADE